MATSRPVGIKEEQQPNGSRLSSRSLTDLAVEAIRSKILSGEFAPGQRLVEERLTELLGISRPPLREGMRLLQQEGLIVTLPRRGSTVAALDEDDVHEILTLRSGLEHMAIDLAMPVEDKSRLRSCWEALEAMESSAAREDRAQLVRDGYAFHASIVALAGHRRLNNMYASVQQQVMLCMARNLRVREHHYEDLQQHVARHRYLLELIEKGDPQAVLAELAVHGERSFTLPAEEVPKTAP
ncbi:MULTISPECIES: GntR family transcriptional regulator [unclassified Pseudarthrobacter]|uniref:GntR family transcriptional regulator n=1 Tax=unclassified Pseudarthrobacter TaxID=2647000 RepID=UPI0030783098